jgi:hypothetical protein
MEPLLPPKRRRRYIKLYGVTFQCRTNLQQINCFADFADSAYRKTTQRLTFYYSESGLVLLIAAQNLQAQNRLLNQTDVKMEP